MIKYIDKGTARQHLTDRLIESALANVGFNEDADAVFLDIAKNRLPVWLDEIGIYDVAEVKHGQWNDFSPSVDTKYCSVCGYNIISEDFETPYCPWCGAKMDEDNTTQYTECVVNLYTETKLRFVLDECIEDEELIEKILKALDEETE